MKWEIQTQVAISCNDGKAIPVPAALIQEHDDRKWLQLRPTSYPLNQIIFGKEAGKNPSFSNHPSFQAFLTKRNKMWTQIDEANQDDLFGEDGQPGKPKKRKVENEPEVVQVPLGDDTIACLMQGKRPTKSDFVVPLEEDQLKPIFTMLQEEKAKESLKQRKTYNKAKTSAVPGQPAEPNI